MNGVLRSYIKVKALRPPLPCDVLVPKAPVNTDWSSIWKSTQDSGRSSMFSAIAGSPNERVSGFIVGREFPNSIPFNRDKERELLYNHPFIQSKIVSQFPFHEHSTTRLEVFSS